MPAFSCQAAQRRGEWIIRFARVKVNIRGGTMCDDLGTSGLPGMIGFARTRRVEPLTCRG